MTDFIESPRLAAAKRGDTTYTAVKPCKRGHAPTRYVSDGSCAACSGDRAKARNAMIKSHLAAARAAASGTTEGAQG